MSQIVELTCCLYVLLSITFFISFFHPPPLMSHIRIYLYSNYLSAKSYSDWSAIGYEFVCETVRFRRVLAVGVVRLVGWLDIVYLVENRRMKIKIKHFIHDQRVNQAKIISI